MVFVSIVLISIAILLLLYILSLRGRVGFTDFKGLKGWRYAHRGLFSEGIPENSIAAFKKACENGYGIEFDVHIMSDGELAIIHDHSLLRTAGKDVIIENLSFTDLNDYRLEGTKEKIPTFKEVLKIVDGNVPIIIELKATEKNVERLCREVLKQLNGYKGDYCVESFDPRCVHWFKKNAPNIIRGQLSENFFKRRYCKINFFFKLLMSMLLTNFLTRPDFVAYRFSDKKHISFKICKKIWKMQGVGWTITDLKDIENAEKENIIPIFEKIQPK